jgi:hypothetical protein
MEIAMTNQMIEPQKIGTPRLNFFKGGFILAGITLVIGLLWGMVSNYSMVGLFAYALFGVFAGDPISSLSSLFVYFVIFLYGTLINFVTVRRSVSHNKLVRAFLFLLAFMLIIFYLFVLLLGFFGNG